MSSNDSSPPEPPLPAVDPELDELLDSAFEDFGKPPPQVNKTQPGGEGGTKDGEWTEDFIQQATKQFEQNMRLLLSKNSDLATGGTPGGDMSEQVKHVAEAAARSTIEGASGSGDIGDLLAESLKELAEGAKNLQEENLSEEQMNSLFSTFGFGGSEDAAGDDENIDAYMPFMQNMMSSLLSKDVLYPAIKDVYDKYPDWLSSNQSSLSQSQYKKYCDQSALMGQVCVEFESEKGGDSEQTKKERFERILQLMHRMQACGQPPKDLVGDEPGIPTMPEQCSVM